MLPLEQDSPLSPLQACRSCPKEDEFLTLALKAINEGLWDWHVDTGEIFFWPRWKEMFGYTDAELDNTFHGWQTLIHPDDLGNWLNAWTEYMEGAAEDFTVEYRLRDHGGSWHWVLCRGVGNRDEQGKISRIAGCHSDITPLKDHQRQLEKEVKQRTLELRRANKKLKALASKDHLTGIWNRRSFDEMMAREWKLILRHGGIISVIMADVDHFKGINDDFGHQNGDACLKWVADILFSQLVRPSDAVFRYGGEEFILLLPATNLAGAIEVAERIREKIASSIPPSGIRRHCTISLGVATCDMSCPDKWQALVAQADDMLYRAKENGRNRVVSKEWINTISSHMISDHHQCDKLLSQVKAAVVSRDWNIIANHLQVFFDFILLHFKMEEEILLPVLEQHVCLSLEQVQVIRLEHAQMRELFDAMAATVKQQNVGKFMGYIKKLRVMLQHHSTEEESLLYRIADQALTDTETVLVQMSAMAH